MRKHILSALYAANTALQHWLDAGEYCDETADEIARLTLDIDALRVMVERDGFGEFVRERFHVLGSVCGKIADKEKGYGCHLLRFMGLMGGAV